MSLAVRTTGRILCLLVGFAGIVSEQPAQAKTVESAPATARPVESAPIPPGAVPARWRVYCGSRAEPIDCQARQSVYRKKTGEHLVSVTVQIKRDSRKLVMRIQLPLGIDIAAGASLQVGMAPAKSVPLSSCNRHGCFVDYAISKFEVVALIRGERLRISVRDRHRVMIRYRVSGDGFAEAYAKIK